MKILLIFSLFLLLSPLCLAQPPRGPHPVPKIEAAKSELPEKPVQEAILSALEAIEADDFAHFAHFAHFALLGTENFKAGLTKEWFDSMAKTRAPRLQNGYNIVYFGDIKRENYTVYMWKLVFADKGDEWLGEIGWKNGKMDGFKIH